jgi:AcrR family transcriptional regulator
VPRITAPTVAEHRAAQRTALLRAAAEVIVTDGVAAATPSTVGERAGIARSTVYDYFASREELLVAVAINAFEEWERDLSAALEDVPEGLPRLHRYIEATMALGADGRHDLATAMRPADLSPSRREEIVALHDALVGPLMTVLAEAGVQAPAEYAPYVQAMIGVGLARVADGDDPRAVAARLNRVIADGLPREA